MTSDAGLKSADGARVGPRPVALFRTFLSALNGIGSVWFFGLTFLIAADIIGRTFFFHPLRGVPEMVGYSVAAAVFLQLAHTLHVGRFTRAEAILGIVHDARPIAGLLLEALYCLIGAAIFFALLYSVYPHFVTAWQDNEIVGVPGYFTLTIWPFRLILVIGAAATGIEFVLQFLAQLRTIAARIKDPVSTAKARSTVGLSAILIVCIAAIAWLAVSADMSNAQIGIVSVVSMLLLILIGMPIGIALMGLSFCGIWLMRGDPTLSFNTLGLASGEYLVNYVFGVIPLFVIMGLLVNVSDIGRDTFEVARRGLRRIKGGLGIATVAANAVFAAITGTSIASAALFSKIATPEMLRHGYSVRFSVGVVAGSSVLGMLIPPSLLLIIYGFLAEVSVGILFLAAIVPGLILAGAFSLGILLMAYLAPRFMGAMTADAIETPMPLLEVLRKLAPIVILIVLVLGGIYGGIFTPTEAGAAGALGALVVALLKRCLTWPKLGALLVEAGHITVSILFLIFAANIYARMLTLSGVPQQMSTFIASTELGFYGFIALYVAFLILLGMFLDSVSIMLIVLPFALPVVALLGGDLIWFGIVTVIVVEIGLLTPPMGLTVFVVKSTLNDARVTLGQIFAGAFPFVVIMLLVTILLIAMPQLATVFT